MRFTLLCLVLTVAGCTGSDSLPEGRWTGSLRAMNHLDSPTPLAFDVAARGETLDIVLIGPDGTGIPLTEPSLDGCRLRYSFREPEQNVLLACELENEGTGVFEGKCAAPDGQWALFRMVPPAMPAA